MPPVVRAFAQLIGGSRVPLELEQSSLTASAVYEAVAATVGRPVGSFKLVMKGKAVDAASSAKVAVGEGDCLVVMPQRKPTSERLVNAALDAQRGAAASTSRGDGDSDDEEEEPTTSLPADAPQWERAVVEALRQRRCPPQLLQWLILIRPRTFLYLILFMAGCVVANKFSMGPPFILVTMIVVIFRNLGRRKKGEMSAYSVFNEGVQRLPGQLDADAIDQQLRRGQLM